MSDPHPGRPRTRGVGEDLVDAGAVFAVVAAVRSVLDQGRDRSGPIRVLRVATWYMWESPRLPQERVKVHYPKSFPWSSRARDRWSASNGKRPGGGWKFVLEHLYPLDLLLRDLLDRALVSDPEGVVELLSSRLIVAVITQDEHSMVLNRGGSPRRGRAMKQTRGSATEFQGLRFPISVRSTEQWSDEASSLP